MDTGEFFEEYREMMQSFTGESREALYSSGYSYYRSGHYDKAIPFFRFLSFVDPKERRFWMGLAASLQMKGEYAEAAACYGIVTAFGDLDPLPHYYAAECFRALEQCEPMQGALKATEMLAKKNPVKYRSLLAQIALVRKGAKSTRK